MQIKRTIVFERTFSFRITYVKFICNAKRQTYILIKYVRKLSNVLPVRTYFVYKYVRKFGQIGLFFNITYIFRKKKYVGKFCSSHDFQPEVDPSQNRVSLSITD